MLDVDGGEIIINDATVAIKTTDGDSRLSSRTYFLTFTDRVSINGSWFVNHQVLLRKSPVVSALSPLNVTLHRGCLSVPYLQDQSLRNIQHICDLKKNLVGKSILSIFAVASITLACCGIIWYIRRRCVNRNQAVGNAIPGREIEVQSAVDGPLYRWEELTPIAQQTERATVSSNDS